jgi:CubicO group peptidase (beta-lactamase class C family)
LAGTRYFYASIEPDVVGQVVRHAVSKSLSDYLTEQVWQPIGAEADSAWLLDAEGFELPHSGFNAALRDYARLAHLLAHDGAWEGRQIILSRWMAPKPLQRMRIGGYSALWRFQQRTER